MERLIPGTTLKYKEEKSVFSTLRPLIRAADGLTLSQVCAITGLEGSTIQNWVKRGYVARPINKKYRERQLARIILISALRDSMQIDKIGLLMKMVNGSAEDESDDIIPEDRLYDYFCEIIMEYFEKGPSLSEVQSHVKLTLKEYVSKSENDTKRLSDALTVMAYAYIASVYKNEADIKFSEMEAEENEKKTGHS